MAVVSAPYATGTITSVSGTTVVISGGAVAGWVGRCIRMTGGTAQGQIRKITAFTSATQVTVDFAWNLSPFTALGFTESDPTAGDTFVISHLIADIVDGTTVIADTGTLSYRFVGASTFSGGAFLYAANSRIELPSASIAAGSPTTEATRCCFRFGDIDQFGNVYNGCFLTDSSGAPSGWGTGSAATRDPDFHFYGGMIRCTGAGPFWRLHSEAGLTARIIGVNIDGNIGGRIIGTKTILKDWIVVGDTSASGPFNPKAPIGKIANIKSARGLQGIYQYWPDSLTVAAEGIITDSTVTKLVRFANVNTVGQMFTVIDFSLSVLQSMTLLFTNSTGGFANTFRLAQYLNASYLSAAGVSITDPTRFVIRDNVPTIVYDDAVTTGAIPKQTVRYRDMTISAVGDYTLATSTGTTYAPYAIAAISYLYQPASLPLPLATSQDVNLVALVDADISQTVRATVDAYTEITNLDRLYDRAKAWTCDNLSAANPSFGAQVAIGNGKQLDLGAFDIVVDATAASAFVVAGNTVTIKASTLVAGAKFATLKTTGTLTLANGASMGISYTTGAGSFAAISVSGLQEGSRVQIYDTTAATELYNGVVAGTSYSAIFPFVGANQIRVRANKIGYLPWLGTATHLAGGISFTASQVADAVYNSNGTNGALVTGITPDNLNLHLDISEADGTLEVPTIYAYACYLQTTSGGIADFFDCITAEDAYDYRINIPLLLDNVNPTRVQIVDGRLYRADGANIISATSGPIHVYETRKGTVLGLGTVEAKVGELHAIQGLKSGAPMVVTPSARTADGITLAISGDGVTSTTVIRS